MNVAHVSANAVSFLVDLKKTACDEVVTVDVTAPMAGATGAIPDL